MRFCAADETGDEVVVCVAEGDGELSGTSAGNIDVRNTCRGKGLKQTATEYTGYTQKNGAVSINISIETAPFFCVCPVFTKIVQMIVKTQIDRQIYRIVREQLS
jgi:hypothetical protein